MDTRFDVASGLSVYGILKTAEKKLETMDMGAEGNPLWDIAGLMVQTERIVEGAVPGSDDIDMNRLMGCLTSVCMDDLEMYVSARLQDVGVCVDNSAGDCVGQAGLALWELEVRGGVPMPNNRLESVLKMVGHGLGQPGAADVIGSLGGRGVCTFLQRYLRGGLWALARIRQTLSHAGDHAFVDGIPPLFTVRNTAVFHVHEHEVCGEQVQILPEVDMDLADFELALPEMDVEDWAEVREALRVAPGEQDSGTYKVTPRGFQSFLKSLPPQ